MNIAWLATITVLVLAMVVLVCHHARDARPRRQSDRGAAEWVADALGRIPVRDGPADPTRRPRRVVYCGMCGRPELDSGLDRCQSCAEPLETSLWAHERPGDEPA